MVKYKTPCRHRKQYTITINPLIHDRSLLLAARQCRNFSGYIEYLLVEDIRQSKLYTDEFVIDLYKNGGIEYVKEDASTLINSGGTPFQTDTEEEPEEI